MFDITALSKALFATHQVELDPGDKVEFVHNYAGHHIVDVIVTDVYTGKSYIFPCFDTRTGVFPY